MHRYKISDLAALFGITVKTLKYYDEIDLLKPACRDTKTGYRYYDNNSIDTLSLILILKNAGVPLQNIKAYFHSSYIPGTILNILIRQRDLLNQNIEAMSMYCAEPGVHIVKDEIIPDVHCIYSKNIVQAKEDAANQFIKLNELAVKLKVRIMPMYCYIAESHSLNMLSSTTYINQYLEIDPDSITPFAEKSPFIKDIMKLKGGRFLTTVHRGPYAGLKDAYQKILNYAHANDLRTGIGFRKYYLKNCANTNQEDDFITKLAVPITM